MMNQQFMFQTSTWYCEQDLENDSVSIRLTNDEAN